MKKESVQALCDSMRALGLPEGKTTTTFPFLTFYRFTSAEIEIPQTENFHIYTVADGSLRLFTPSGILDYVPGQYSISQIDTPSSGHVQAFSERGDFLALSIEFTLNEVISVILDLEGSLAEQIADGKMEDSVMLLADERVISAICRLISLLHEPIPTAFLGKQFLREIIYDILCGSCGRQFLQSIINIQKAGEIYEVNSWIKENFRSSFTVEELAARRNMSVSLFHQKFKSAVGMGPLQCQKRLRLTEARRLMLDENKNVTEASLDVGYESTSQFIRDYRKMFGLPPGEDIGRLRGDFSTKKFSEEN